MAGQEALTLSWAWRAEVTTLFRAILLLVVTPICAFAQAQTVERAVKAQPDKDVRVGVYVNVQPDCTSGPLPTIRLSDPPTNGRVVVKRAKIGVTNYKQCLSLQVTGLVAFYRSKPGFSGTDTLSLEVKLTSGKTQIERITVTVSGEGSGQSI
jgi:hypothetical protein